MKKDDKKSKKANFKILSIEIYEQNLLKKIKLKGTKDKEGYIPLLFFYMYEFCQNIAICFYIMI